LSDYPDPVITANLVHNVTENFHDPPPCKVVPHAWGTDAKDLLESNSGTLFDVILLSDVVWISDQHMNLLETCTKVLCSQGRIYLTCGVHSGWQCVDRFLQLAHDTFGLAHNVIERRTHQSWGAHAAEAIDDIALRNRTILVYEFWSNR
jgi:predicted nicotinamide N-methyase